MRYIFMSVGLIYLISLIVQSPDVIYANMAESTPTEIAYCRSGGCRAMRCGAVPDLTPLAFHSIAFRLVIRS